ncbi:hypothetical protein ACFLSJ_01440 [Verrucomicrobiota bacterium]
MTEQPLPWDRKDRAGSLYRFAEWLHEEARTMFLQDASHVTMLFLFKDDGIASMNPVPAGTKPDQLLAGVRRAVKENDLYAVVSVGEAWTYFPKTRKDHTAFQLLDGEMSVSDLGDGDRTEALLVRMESRDGDHVTWLDPIVRDDDQVTLGETMRLPREAWLNYEGYFD